LASIEKNTFGGANTLRLRIVEILKITPKLAHFFVSPAYRQAGKPSPNLGERVI